MAQRSRLLKPYERLWALMNDVYAGYDAYQGRTEGRRIPVVVLELVR